MIKFLYQTGCRVSELCAAEWSGLLRRRRGTDGQWYCRLKLHGKGSKEREVAVRFDLITRIKDEFRGERFLFESSQARKYHRNSVSARIHYWAAVALGRTDVSAHTLRHSYATHQVDRGQSITKVQRQLGHNGSCARGKNREATRCPSPTITAFKALSPKDPLSIKARKEIRNCVWVI